MSNDRDVLHDAKNKASKTPDYQDNDESPLKQGIFLCPHTLPEPGQEESVGGSSSRQGSSRRGSPTPSRRSSGINSGQRPISAERLTHSSHSGSHTSSRDTLGKEQIKRPEFGQQQEAVNRAFLGPPQRVMWYHVWSSWIVNHKYVVAFTTFLTVYALTGDDFRLLATNKPADSIFNVFTILCLLFFSLEIILSCLGKDDYFPGFFFGLDVVSTVTLILDLTWVSEYLVGDEDDFDRARSGRTARMGAKMGRIVRVIRLIRIVKLYKAFYESRGSKQKKLRRVDTLTGEEIYDPRPGEEEDEQWASEDANQTQDTDAPQRESRVGKKLSALTTRRVIILVLTMLLVLPLLRAEESQQTPASPAYGADDVHEAFRDMLPDDEISRLTYEKTMLRYIYYHNWFVGAQGECPRRLSKQGCSNNYFSNLFWAGIASEHRQLRDERAGEAKLRSETVAAWEINASRQDDVYNYGIMPPEVVEIVSSPWTQACEVSQSALLGFSLLTEALSEHTGGYAINCPDDLRSMERSKWNPRLLSLKEYQEWHFAFYFDLRPQVRAEAGWNLVITTFVCLVLCVASVFFSKDANTLVLEPVETMITKVNMIRDNPLIAVKMADNEFKVEEIEKMKQSRMNKEHLLKVLRNLLFCRESNTEILETVILDKTIIKLGTLLALGFGEAGANIVRHNMADNSAGVNAMIDGTRVDCILGNARIEDFSCATEVLQSKVMTFVNRIAEIVHGVINEFAGAANKNDGDRFLLIWRLGESLEQETATKIALEQETSTKIADMAMVAFAKVLGAVHRSPVLAVYRGHPGLQQRLGQQCRVNLTFGLHQGWAIEGAVGTEFKIDASYLSPHVSIAASVLHATSIYGVPFVASQTVVGMCTKEIAEKCRMIDKVRIKGSKLPMTLYSLDLDFMSLQVDEPKRRYYVWNLRQRYRARQLLEAEKDKKWEPEVSMSEIFDQSPDIAIMRRRYTTEFLQLFNMGYQNYLEGEWPVARRLLSHTQNSLGIRDGPSMALLRFMEAPFQFEAPEGWQGVHEFGGGFVQTKET